MMDGLFDGIRCCGFAGVVLLAFAAAGDPPGPIAFPARAPSGLSLVVPSDTKGKVYSAIPDRERQASFVSDTPIETVEGHTRSIVGFAVAGPAEDPANLRAGAWAMPVKSLTTGLANRDAHIREAQWLDAARFPDVTFRLTRVTGIEATKPGVYTAVLEGDFSVKGTTRPIQAKGSIAFLKETPESKTVVAGDLMRLTMAFTIRLSDYGVSNDIILVRKKIAEEITIMTDLVLSTVPPEQQPRPKGEAETP